MAVGKYLSLEYFRKKSMLKRFVNASESPERVNKIGGVTPSFLLESESQRRYSVTISGLKCPSSWLITPILSARVKPSSSSSDIRSCA